MKTVQNVHSVEENDQKDKSASKWQCRLGGEYMWYAECYFLPPLTVSDTIVLSAIHLS